MRMFGFYNDAIMDKLNSGLSEILIDCSHETVKFDIKRESEFVVSLHTDNGIVVKYNTNRLKITRAYCKKPKNDEVVLDLYRICVTLSGGWD